MQSLYVFLQKLYTLKRAAFLAAFARFVGRRGLPSKVFSDNGKNLVGASRVLKSEFDNFLQGACKEVKKKYNVLDFEWSFILPYVAHMGGLWEAAVKSFKTHFKKIASDFKLTFEEFSTLFTQIEAVLNS